MCIRLQVFIAWTVMMAQATTCLAAHIDIRQVPLPMAKSRARKELVSAVEDLNRQIRADAVDCDGYYRSRARVLLDTTSAFSIELSVDKYCGGPHPETDVKAVVFDAVTGDRYSPLALYEVGRRKTLTSESNGALAFATGLRQSFSRMPRPHGMVASAGRSSKATRRTISM